MSGLCREVPEVILAMVAPRALDPALDLTRQVILSWAKRVAMDPPLLEWVAQAWSREVDRPSPPGKPRGPIALIITQLRGLGWEPTEPGLWHQGTEPRSVRDMERLRNHLDQALALSRWESLATRRRDFAVAENGIDEGASFRGPRKALDARKNITFGKYACILLGAPGPGTVTPGRVLTLTRAPPCARIPRRPCCTACGCAQDGTSLEARKVGSWPPNRKPLTGNRSAYGNAGSCQRRPPAIAPPLPPRKPTAANRRSASSQGGTSFTPMPRLCAPGALTLGGQHAPSGRGTTSRTRQPGPCPGRFKRFTEPNSTPSPSLSKCSRGPGDRL